MNIARVFNVEVVVIGAHFGYLALVMNVDSSKLSTRLRLTLRPAGPSRQPTEAQIDTTANVSVGLQLGILCGVVSELTTRLRLTRRPMCPLVYSLEHLPTYQPFY
ncbi:hypothetical protein AB4K20DRAFT_1988719 [Rhizopus microsporus]